MVKILCLVEVNLFDQESFRCFDFDSDGCEEGILFRGSEANGSRLKIQP
jgi:hypothetical protein